MAKKTPQLEQSLDSLEALVERMESGELTLEESLQAFEQGVKLTRECQQALSQAEQKVRIRCREHVKKIAINDAFTVEMLVYKVLKRHFAAERCYVRLVDLMLETTATIGKI